MIRIIFRKFDACLKNTSIILVQYEEIKRQKDVQKDVYRKICTKNGTEWRNHLSIETTQHFPFFPYTHEARESRADRAWR